MRAVVCQQFGALEGLEVQDLPVPAPGPGQLLIGVRAAGASYVDALTALGGYQIKPPTPYVPGGEVAGVVEGVGEGVEGFEVGQRVVAMTGLDGGFAEKALAPAVMAFALPDSLEDGIAAAMLQAYGTAMFALKVRTSLAEGEWVLVLGAGGGVGLAFVDLAAALGGRVIAAASSDDKLAAARDAGANATIAYEDVDLKAAAREISAGGVDVVVDPVGGRHSEPALRATRRFGRLLVVGFASGSIASIPLNQVLLNNRTVIGVEWGGWVFREPQRNRELLGEALDMAARGVLRPAKPSVRSLDDAPDVLRSLVDREVAGKVVLAP